MIPEGLNTAELIDLTKEKGFLSEEGARDLKKALFEMFPEMTELSEKVEKPK